MGDFTIYSPELTEDFIEELLYDNEQSTLDKPYLVAYNTDDDEYSVHGYDKKEDAIDDIRVHVRDGSIDDSNWMLLGFYDHKRELPITIHVDTVIEE